MNKQALSNLEIALVSALTGGGLYAGGRGLKNLINPPQEETQDELEVVLPSNKITDIPKFANDQQAFPGQDLATKIMTGGLAGTAGFLGASKLYEIQKMKQLQEEEEEAKKTYLSHLMLASQKVASLETPLVDQLCEGLASGMVEKVAESSLYAPGAGPVSLMNKGVESIRGVPGINPGLNAAGATLALLGALAAGGTYGVGKYMDSKGESEEDKSKFPRRVKIRVADPAEQALSL